MVTGATGNVGRELIRQLLLLDVHIRAGLRKSSDVKPAELRDCECVTFDFLDERTFEVAFKGVESVFLMRPPALSDPEKEIAPALRAARKAGVARIVFLSVLGAEKNPFVPHHKIEKLVSSMGFTFTFLRPSYFMQNLSTTHAFEIRNDDEILIPAGSGKTDFIDVRDIAAVAAKALTADGFENVAISLTGPAAISFRDVSLILSQELGRTIRYKNPSVLRFLLAMRRRHFDYSFIGVMVAIYTITRLGFAETLTGDVQRILGREPNCFADFAKLNRRAWLKNETPTAIRL